MALWGYPQGLVGIRTGCPSRVQRMLVGFAPIGLQTAFLRNLGASTQVPLLVLEARLGAPIGMVLVHTAAGV
jgi:hypothetical protein